MDGRPIVPVSGKVVGEIETRYMKAAAEELVLTGGPWGENFSRKLRSFLKVRHVSLCNSGSSANLLALSALTSRDIPEPYRLMPGNGIITVAASFPTTVAPIYQIGCIPIFLDIELGTYNVDVKLLDAALPYLPKAIILAHTLGNPFNIDEVLAFCKEHKIWLVEDNCDALGSKWKGRFTGTFGVYSTLSFYPAHHITTGEGGAVVSYNGRRAKIVNSFRDWGRDCWCSPGNDNTCGKRFAQSHGALPHGYDHKYVYSHLGYNLKMTEMQAACGAAQMERLEGFVKARQLNFHKLDGHMHQFEDLFILPEWSMHTEPSWFGYPLTIRDKAPFSRQQLTGFLENYGIATRPIFGGNITEQPAFKDRKYIAYPRRMPNANKVMKDSFWVGIWPGLQGWKIEYIAEAFRRFVEGHT